MEMSAPCPRSEAEQKLSHLRQRAGAHCPVGRRGQIWFIDQYTRLSYGIRDRRVALHQQDRMLEYVLVAEHFEPRPEYRAVIEVPVCVLRIPAVVIIHVEGLRIEWLRTRHQRRSQILVLTWSCGSVPAPTNAASSPKEASIFWTSFGTTARASTVTKKDPSSAERKSDLPLS